VGHDKPEWTSLGVDRSAVQRVRDKNLRVRHARVQFGDSEDYFVSILGLHDDAGSHEFSAKLVSLGDARSSEQLFQQNAFVGLGFIFMGIRNVESGSGHVFQVGGSQRERCGNRAADFELRNIELGNGGVKSGLSPFGRMRKQTGRRRRRLRKWQFGDFDPPWKLLFCDEVSSRLLLLDHDFCGLNYGGNGIAYLEVHFLRASPGDYALDEIISNLDDHVGHHSAELKLRNLALKPVAC
jgi:hypothetical protein